MNIGASALSNNSRALDTIGHNIANVNTPGYSRQSVVQNSIPGQKTGAGFIGKGVETYTVLRQYNELLNRQSVAASAASAADTARYQSIKQMQEVYTGGDSGLGAAINGVFSAFGDVANAPTDATARNVVLTRMTEMTSRFRSASELLNEQEYATKQQLHNGIDIVNNLAGQVAALNSQISRALASGHSPNDLLDARDQLIREINQYVQTSQVDSDNGAVNLFVGGSQPLVLESLAAQLSVGDTPGYTASGKLSLFFSMKGGQQVELTERMVSGGEIAGLLKFNNDDLVQGRNLLGRMALTIGNALNQQNAQGLTLDATQGKDLFQLANISKGFGSIAGSNEATTEVRDHTQLVASDYKIIFGDAGTAPRLQRLSDGVTLGNLVLNGTNYEIEQDGLRFSVPQTVATAAVKNDTILFQPYRNAAATIAPLMVNANELAVGNAVTVDLPKVAAKDKDGNLTGNQVEVMRLTGLKTSGIDKIKDAAGVLNAPIDIKFDTDASGKITYEFGTWARDPATGNITEPKAWTAFPAPAAIPPATEPPFKVTGDYVAGQPIELVGRDAAGVAVTWGSITLTGTPPHEYSATISDAMTTLHDDGRILNSHNALAFLDLRDAKVFDGGTTLEDGFASAMAVVGARAQSAKMAAELSSTVASNLEMDRTAVSGVNKDEEAARLLQYQQAYQASAKVIQVAQSLFDSVLNAVGGR